MGSNGILVTPSDPPTQRDVLQIVGRDLGQDDWGSKINWVSFHSDTEYLATLRNLGVGGHLNIAKSTDGSGLLSVTDAFTEIATLQVSGTEIVSGDLTLSARLIMAAAAAKIVGGATSLSIRDHLDTLDNLLVTNAGAVTTRADLTVASGNATLTSGALVYGAAHSSIVPGATDFSIRNHANSADNILTTDAGLTTLRAGLIVAGGGGNITGGLTVATGNLSLTSGITNLGGKLTVLSGGADIAGGLTISSGNLALTSGITNLGGKLSVLSGGADITGGLKISTGTLILSDTASQIIPGTTSLALMNNAGSASNLLLTDAGAATVRNGLTVTAGGLTVTAGNLAVSSGTITGSSTVQGTRLISTLAAGGLAPIVVTSDTLVTNLNADKLDGLDSTAFLTSLAGAVLTDSSSQTKSGALTIQGTFSTEGNTVVGNASADTLTVNATTTFATGATFTTLTSTGSAPASGTIRLANGLSIVMSSSGGTAMTALTSDAFDRVVLGDTTNTSEVWLNPVNEARMRVGGVDRVRANGTGIGFFNSSPNAKQTITGAKAGNVALTNLLSALANYGLVTDSTT